MATQILLLHWKAVRIGLIPFVVAAFALPLIAVQGLGTTGGGALSLDAYRAVAAFQIFMPLFPLLAAAVGATLALSAWNWDHQQGHVYALSLPLRRWEYSLLKLGAGVVLALIPTGALLTGSLLATASVDLPTGLNAYPLDLTLRFLFASLLAYGVLFALASGTTKTATIVLTSLIVLPLVAEGMLGFMANFFPSIDQVSVVEEVFRAIWESPGPLRVFFGNWMLIDV
ncbi:MAG TPA: hypothetical protein VGA70_11910 [Longimicrobiales bacterium]|jgi:hypothetical protein